MDSSALAQVGVHIACGQLNRQAPALILLLQRLATGQDIGTLTSVVIKVRLSGLHGEG